MLLGLMIAFPVVAVGTYGFRMAGEPELAPRWRRPKAVRLDSVSERIVRERGGP
jgi:hypothetical protein